MNGNYTIGLIGGVGPWAGLDVHRKILEESSYSTEQDCVSVVHVSFPGKYTDRTDYLLGKTKVNPAYAFAEELRMLEASGAGTAAIVCNTAHAGPIFRVLETELSGSSLTYVNIIRETQAVLMHDGIRKVGLLATLGTYSLDLYGNGFSGTVVNPSKNNQHRVHNIIYNAQTGLKTHYPNYRDEHYSGLIEVARALAEAGAEALVLGCTELPLLAELERYVDLPVYDPNRILAKALVQQATQAGTAGLLRSPKTEKTIVSTL
jgi:aspartate racemase